MNATPVSPYDAFYFATSCGAPYERSQHWLTFFGNIAEQIVRELHPASVLDAGCAMGFLVEALRDRGVEAFGIDVSTYAIERVREDIRAFCTVDSVTTPLTRQYDLIVCIEVLEHLTPAEAEQAIANFCAHTDRVLFSSTPLDHKEATHINVHPPEDWAELFAHNGFLRDVDFDASFITQWAALFRRSQASLSRVVRDYERKFWWTWKENVDLRRVVFEMRNQLSAEAEIVQNLNTRVTAAEQRQLELAAELTSAQRDAARWRVQFEAVTNSTAWRLLRRLGQVRSVLAPRGSTRAHIGRFVFRVLGIK